MGDVGDGTRRLLLLRHGKSAWDSQAEDDFARPLAPRGRRDAPRIGRWLLEHALIPDQILCSGAARTRETVALLMPVLGLEAPHHLEVDDALYHADRATLLAAVSSIDPRWSTVLLAAHNPGLDHLLVHLCGPDLERTSKGKLMTTAALANVSIEGSWDSINPEHCSLTHLVRPRELPLPRN